MIRDVACVFILGGATAFLACVPLDAGDDEQGAKPGEAVLAGGLFLPEVEPNDTFDQAMPVDAPVLTRIEATLDGPGDRDVFALRTSGSHVRLNTLLENAGPGDACVCVFDDQQRLLARSSVRNAQAAQALDLLVPEAVGELFLFAFMNSNSAATSYSISLNLRESEERLARLPQVVLLNFDGAAPLRVAGRTYPFVPPFDVATIDSRHAGRTQTVIEQVLELVRADYEGVHVHVYLASDPDLPAGPHSVIHFGGSNPDLLGLADGVDPYNRQASDSAVIYTDTFQLFAALNPGEQAIAQVLANVTTHEIGHLLGLRHTADPDDLMDVTATARRLMGDQWFKRARLHATVCPMGEQDSPAMLAWTVGGQLGPPPKDAFRPFTDFGGPDDFEIPRAWLSSGCSGE